jgi:predicted amidophosphoribosyltransferase
LTMTRYGYQDMPDNYTDIGTHRVAAICVDCGAGLNPIREECWLENGRLMTHCGCTELPEEPHPWAGNYGESFNRR